VALVRSIGRWAMTALVINCIIGSGIFGVPSELARLLGRASPLAMLVAAAAMTVIMACFAEVASQFSSPGGAYLYVRTAFGRFAGMQVGWFWWLAVIGGGAASANLFVTYLGELLPEAERGLARAAVLAGLVAVPAAANYAGVRSGSWLSTVTAIAKLVPLGLLIALGLGRFSEHATLIPLAEIAAPGWSPWLTALLLLLFSYGGYEDALVPSGEVKQVRTTAPFALTAGLAVCALVYTLLQFVTVATVGTTTTSRPIADLASALIGRGGATFVVVAVMISTYGWVAGGMLNAPRLPHAFAEHGDCPAWFGSLHRRFNTPARAILLYAVLVWILAATGTFLWVLELTAGSMMVIYAAVCLSLLRLRHLQPAADALRVPAGNVLAVAGALISVVLLSQLKPYQALLMGVTSLLGMVNWAWASGRHRGRPLHHEARPDRFAR
jgi:basic amino acid/polyamine antiporter, APA family